MYIYIYIYVSQAFLSSLLLHLRMFIGMSVKSNTIKYEAVIIYIYGYIVSRSERLLAPAIDFIDANSAVKSRSARYQHATTNTYPQKYSTYLIYIPFKVNPRNALSPLYSRLSRNTRCLSAAFYTIYARGRGGFIFMALQP